MWTCKSCGRIFDKANQMHSCKKVPIESHFENKELAANLYKQLLKIIESEIGKVKEISLPCCIHLFGNYDFIALLPKKDKLEIRFALDRILKSPRIVQTVPLSATNYKHQLFIASAGEIDEELTEWIKESYDLKK